MYRWVGEKRGTLEVMVVHPGGPYWEHRDLGAWSIPKGELDEDEDPLAAARRELTEETGCVAEGEFLSLGSVKQRAGKIVMAWGVEGDCDTAAIQSNTFPMEYPPRSGKWIRIPEVDRAGWFSPGLLLCCMIVG